MKLDDLFYQFIVWGKLIRPSEFPYFKRYLTKMLERNRVMVIEDEDEMQAILCFFLTDDIKKFDNRPTWSTPYDTEDGEIIFIDKMVAKVWTKELRNTVYEAIETKYPWVNQAVWLREPKNRHVIINKRRTHVHSKVS